MAIIAEEGVERLSLRDVARRLGVSHQAPYKHYPSRDHVVAEIVARAFADFARHLDARSPSVTPAEDLEAMGRAYLGYATAHPLHYRLMFGTPLPDPREHPAMMRNAQHAFALLCGGLERMAAASGQTTTPADIQRDAVFIWSTMHGLASALQSSALQTLQLPDAILDTLAPHVLGRIGAAFERRDPESGAPRPPPSQRERRLASDGAEEGEKRHREP